jgi:hypothetical protein
MTGAMPRPTCLLLLALAAGCALRPSHLVPAEDHVVVKSVRLPARDWLPWFTRFAEHAWVECKHGDHVERIEWNRGAGIILHAEFGLEGFVADQRWDRDVAVHAEWTGPAAAALAARIRAVADDYPSTGDYLAWPGPNSNTFITWLADAADFGVALPANAVGKDYTPWLAAGISDTGVGLHLDTAVLGAQVGLVEGIELHLLGLTVGIGLWPPVLKLPFLADIPGGWFRFGSVAQPVPPPRRRAARERWRGGCIGQSQRPPRVWSASDENSGNLARGADANGCDSRLEPPTQSLWRTHGVDLEIVCCSGSVRRSRTGSAPSVAGHLPEPGAERRSHQ